MRRVRPGRDNPRRQEGQTQDRALCVFPPHTATAKPFPLDLICGGTHQTKLALVLSGLCFIWLMQEFGLFLCFFFF